MRGTEYWKTSEYYLQLCDNYGMYNAVAIIGAQARALSNLYRGKISHAEALSWITTGIAPKDTLERLDEAGRRDKRIRLWLNDICDTLVRDSVLASINASLHLHNLTYVYKDELSSFKHARVRILTKLLWDYIH